MQVKVLCKCGYIVCKEILEIDPLSCIWIVKLHIDYTFGLSMTLVTVIVFPPKYQKGMIL